MCLKFEKGVWIWKNVQRFENLLVDLENIHLLKYCSQFWKFEKIKIKNEKIVKKAKKTGEPSK